MRISIAYKFQLDLELTEEEMAANPNVFGGLDFTALLDGINSLNSSIKGVVTRLQTVAPAAGSTDPAQSAAAQTEIQNLASQLKQASTQLDAIASQASSAAIGVVSSATGQPAPSGVSTPALDPSVQSTK